MAADEVTGPIWTPSPERVAGANATRFLAFVRREGAPVADWQSLYEWSIAEPARFWPAVWRFTGVIADERAGS